MEENNFYVVGIGYSAGGLEALTNFLDCLPAEPGAAFVIIPHLLPTFRSRLDELLRRYCSLPLQRVCTNTKVEINTVYLLQENTVLQMEGGVLVIHDRMAEHRVNNAIDIFLCSLAEDCGARAISVILSGMGNDGTKGSQRVHDMGGYVLVQHPFTAAYDSMPENVVKSDNPFVITSPCRLAQYLMEILQSKKTQTDEPHF